MSILQTLDRHAFSLLASLSLSGNRSRAKDLWIFTEPHMNLRPTLHRAAQALTSSRIWSNIQHSDALDVEQQHHRRSSLPNTLPLPNSNVPSHARSASTPDAHHRATSVLRKKNSRTLGGSPPLRLSLEDSEQQRMSASSTAETVDMTGVGTLMQRMPPQHMMMIDVDPMQGSSATLTRDILTHPSKMQWGLMRHQVASERENCFTLRRQTTRWRKIDDRCLRKIMMVRILDPRTN